MTTASETTCGDYTNDGSLICNDRSKLSDADLLLSIATFPDPLTPWECHEFELDIEWAENHGGEWLLNNNLLADLNEDGKMDDLDVQEYVFNANDFVFDPTKKLREGNDNPCGTVSDCRCQWGINPKDEDGNLICGNHRQEETSGPEADIARGVCPTGGVGPISMGNCRITIDPLYNDCANTGNYEVSWVALWYDDEFDDEGERTDDCYPGTKKFPCPATAAFPFFTLMTFFSSMIFVFAIYCFLVFRKRD